MRCARTNSVLWHTIAPRVRKQASMLVVDTDTNWTVMSVKEGLAKNVFAKPFFFNDLIYCRYNKL